MMSAYPLSFPKEVAVSEFMKGVWLGIVTIVVAYCLVCCAVIGLGTLVSWWHMIGGK